jgi:hypothetical protein
MENGLKLEAFLEDVLQKDKLESGWTGGVQIVCHSNANAALITFPVINRRPELFHSYLGAAPATRGGMTFLSNMCTKGGSSTILGNTTMLTPWHWNGWTSAVYFMPNKGEWNDRAAEDRPNLTEADGLTEVECDFHVLEDWERCKIGPFDPRSGCAAETQKPSPRSFFRETLRQAKEFRNLMVHDPTADYPPMASLVGDAIETHTTFRRRTPDSPFSFFDDDLPPLTTMGDGLIPASRSTPRTWAVPCVQKSGGASSGGSWMESMYVDIMKNLVELEKLLNDLIAEANTRGKLQAGRK